MSQKPTTAREAIEKIQQEAAGTSAEVRWVRTVQPDDEIRQGDIYLYPMPAQHSLVLERDYVMRNSLQLAPGSSPGARHIIEGEAVSYQSRLDEDPLEGPVLHARKRVVLTHPEHADISIPEGWYGVRYQRDFANPEAFHQSRRVLD